MFVNQCVTVQKKKPKRKSSDSDVCAKYIRRRSSDSFDVYKKYMKKRRNNSFVVPKQNKRKMSDVSDICEKLLRRHSSDDRKKNRKRCVSDSTSSSSSCSPVKRNKNKKNVCKQFNIPKSLETRVQSTIRPIINIICKLSKSDEVAEKVEIALRHLISDVVNAKKCDSPKRCDSRDSYRVMRRPNRQGSYDSYFQRNQCQRPDKNCVPYMGYDESDNSTPRRLPTPQRFPRDNRNNQWCGDAPRRPFCGPFADQDQPPQRPPQPHPHPPQTPEHLPPQCPPNQQHMNGMPHYMRQRHCSPPTFPHHREQSYNGPRHFQNRQYSNKRDRCNDSYDSCDPFCKRR